MREKAVIGDDGSQVSRKGLLAVVRTNLERLEPMPFRARLQDVSNRVQKWNVGPEHRKERETFCGCFGKRTPFLRLRAQLHQDVRKGAYRR